MVSEQLPTKTSGYRPPPNQPPLVTFSPDPDDRDRDMFIYLRDNVKQLLAALREASADQVLLLQNLVDQRRKWILEELEIERMMEDNSNPPLGIESDPYDLAELIKVQRNFRREKFEELIRSLDQAQMRLEQRFWEHLWPSNPSS